MNDSFCNKKLLDALKQLTAASKAGDFDVDLACEGLSQSDTEAIQLINKALLNYRTAVESNIIKYKLTNEALGIGLWDMDVMGLDITNPGNTIMWSQKIRNMLGYNNEQDFPNTFGSLINILHPEDKDRALNAFANHLNDFAGNTPLNGEYRLLLKNNTYRFFHVFGSALRDSIGIPIKVAGALMDIDEKKQIQNQHMIMSKITHNSSDFISYKKLTGECLYINPAASVITGYSHDELIKDYVSIALGDKGTEFSSGIAKELLDKGLVKFEIEGKIKSGETRIFKGTSFLIENDAFATIASDITETKKMEESINAAHERLELMMNTSPVCTQIWDKTFNVIDCNEASVKLYGFKDKQEYIARFMDCCSPMYQPDGQRSDVKAVILIDKAFKEGYCIFDWLHQMPDDGTPIPSEITLVRTKYTSEDVVIGYTRDLRVYNKMITNIKYRDNLLQAVNQAANLLLNSDTGSFETAFQQSMQMIAEIAKIDCAYLWKNYTNNGELYCYQVLEWSLKKTSFVNNELYNYNEVVPGWQETLSSGKYINNIVRNMSLKEQEHLSPDGILSTLVVPVFIKDNFWGFFGFDDCHRERLFTKEEESILHSASLLVANSFILSEAFQDIRDTSAKLESALKLANAASKAKGDFLSNMSHEMRTPMNVIIGMTTIGKKAASIEEKNRTLNKIESASVHLLGVINDILDMTKIEADKLEISSVVFHFKKLLRKVITMIHFPLNEKQQKLTVNVDDKIPRFVVGDDQRLAQVITNLLSNAVKFTPEKGEIRLDVFLINNTDDGNCELRFEVIDNGIGISQEQQEKLFGAFVQVQSGTSREYGGTGLGLLISKRIIELMGGKIWIESELGKGAKFIFIVKIMYTKESADDANKHSEANVTNKSDEAITMEFEGKRLLIVEDIEINREILIALLEDSGLIIDCAENGKEALHMITADPEKYDIVFMDLQMPQMDGLEATRCIRALPLCHEKKLPIIAMTANVFKDDIKACLEAGMNDHIGKPLDIDRIIETLRKYLKE